MPFLEVPIPELVMKNADKNARDATTGWVDRQYIEYMSPDSATLMCKVDSTGLPVGNATVTINGEEVGSTDSKGWISILADKLGLSKLIEITRGPIAYAATLDIPADLAGSSKEFYLPATTSVAPSARFQIGNLVSVANTDGVGLRGRYPDSTSSTYEVLPEGVEGTILDGPSTAGGYNRWKISFPGYSQPMWCAEGEPDGSAFYLVSATPATDPYEPNNTSPTATPLSAGQTVQGYISNTTDEDWFKIVVTGTSQLNINLSVPAGCDYDLELYGPNATWVAGSYENRGLSESISYSATTPGTYWIRVYGYPEGNGSFSTSQAYALSYASNGPVFSYSDNGSTITITGYTTWPVGAVDIPATINGKPVTSIGDSAFYACSDLTSVTIPSSVTSIGNYAFWNCWQLASATIPIGVTSMGDGAFGHCGSLTNVAIPASVNRIGRYAFIHCWGLLNVTIPYGVTSIGYAAFQDCHGLTNVTIPASVTNIGDAPFASCYSLPAITVSSDNTAYKDLDGVLFNKNLNSLIQYPCARSASSYNIPSSVTSIRSYAFSGCSGLTAVTIPAGVADIGNFAFSNCSGLTGVTIPSSVTSIGAVPFQYCTNLTAITVASANSAYSDLDGVLFDKNQHFLIEFPCGGPANYSIPSTVTTIGDSSFSGSAKLTSVTIPSSVTNIGSLAFGSCRSLTTVTIPSSVTNIGWAPFRYCPNLPVIAVSSSSLNYAEMDGVLFDKNLNTLIQYPSGKAETTYTIPSSVTNIRSSAFEGCYRIESLVIPSSVTNIEYGAVWGCTGLRNANFMGNAPTMGSDVFNYAASCFAVFYHSGKSGFTSPKWNGYPAVNIDVNPPAIILDPSTKSIGAGGATYSFSVNANTSWSWAVDAPWWIIPSLRNNWTSKEATCKGGACANKP
ncbi:MAG: leucine-rich repeat protein [Verrucomicrobiae bacterium]